MLGLRPVDTVIVVGATVPRLEVDAKGETNVIPPPPRLPLLPDPLPRRPSLPSLGLAMELFVDRQV